jgi:hypothetical protein
METVVLEFGLMTINLMVAHSTKIKGGNPAFSYFVAGLCCAYGISALIRLF